MKWVMPRPCCPYCRESFDPSRYHPDQIVCSGRECQRRRRTEYHRQKLQNDAAYEKQCTDSREKWRDEHPEYMPNYRRKHGRSRAKTPAVAESARTLDRILECVKNNVAIDLTAFPARIWLITGDESVKNTLAFAQLVVIEGLPQDK